MPQKILVAEEVDSLRTVAESVLRQNGFDVIAVTAAEKAREVLEYSRPDLIIVGASMQAADGTPYFEQLLSEAATASIPILVFEPTDASGLKLPPEAVIGQPLDPDRLLSAVAQRLKKPKPAAPASRTPLDVDDDLLDAALGLDGIDVTDSEVMDKTVVGKRKSKKAGGEKMIGMDHDSGHDALDDSETDIPAVESLMIDEHSDRARGRAQERRPLPDGTGELDILPDQFGLSEVARAAQDDDAAHDYDWFVNSMQNDHGKKPSAPAGKDDGKLHFTNTAASVDPITPHPSGSTAKSSDGAQRGTVDEFIDEFKREMEEIRSSEDEPPVAVPEVVEETVEEPGMEWTDKLEQIGPAQIDLFTREFAQRLGEKVAQIIAAKIDPDKLLRLIRDELVARQKKS